MGPSCPPNLTHSTTYLTDKPYDVQLGVLRWIRGLLFEVIDEAASQLSTTATSIEPESLQHGSHDDNGCGRQEENSLPPGAETRMENKPQEHTQDDEGLPAIEGEGVDDCSSGHGESVRILKTMSKATTDEHGVNPDGDGDGEGGSTGIGRKRPRTPTLHERHTFGVGSVVECFHPVSDPFNRCRLSGSCVPCAV